MEKVITTAMLVIASLVAAIALINAVLPATGKSAGALAAANSEAAKRIKTDIDIIYATGDTSGTITVWVKNVGTQIIRSVKDSDIIIEKPSGAARLSYVDGCSSECWDFTLEDSASAWSSRVTVKFTITTAVPTGNFSVSVAAPNGILALKDFSV
ncbi:MAG: hypothetical protein BZY75_06340 [SAR202 cluster bacterium Io17-Chloro-G7]|nr:MAG: hypothetical protein BZY75_06340 [SAR202 cluster bacterium Io17-Chloro-G7]